MDGMPYAQVVTSPVMHATVETFVRELNAQLHRWEMIRKFIILDHDLTVDSGEVTPSLKIHRHMVAANYREALDALYAE
jgi:long-chain acyl-CoA synthetase